MTVMGLSHETVIGIAKLVGLLSMVALLVGVCLYIFWPGNRARFGRAKRSILNAKDRPANEDEPR